MIKVDRMLVLGFVFLISFIAPVLSMDCSIEPQEFWLDISNQIWLSENYFNIGCNCPANTVKAWFIIIDDEDNQIGENVSLNNNINATGFVNYNIPLPLSARAVISYCNNGTTISETKQFDIHKLEAQLISSLPSVIYPQDILNLNVEFKKDSIPIDDYINSDFKIYLNDELLSLDYRYNPLYSNWEIEAEIPDDFADYGDYDITIKAGYKNNFVVLTTGSTEIKPLLEVNIIDPIPSLNNPCKLVGASNINLTVKVEYKSGLVEQTEPLEFNAMLDGEEVNIETEPSGDGIWILYMTIPERTPKTEPYNLYIFVEYQDAIGESSRPLPIQFVLPFKGKIVDAENYPIHAEIELSGIVPLETDSNGEYSAKITPGNYDVELIFNDMNSIRFYDVTLDNSEIYKYTNNPIKYDSFEGTEMDAIKAIAFEFAFPFKNANIIIPCTGSEFDESHTIIYQCRNWDFVKRHCNSDWEKVKNVDKNNYRISFDIAHFSRIAFAVSEEKSLQLKVNLDKEDYFIGETVSLQGRVFDGNNNSVGDAEVSYKIEDEDIKGSTTTNDAGEFTVSFSAPNESTTFNIEVKAQKVYTSAKPIITSFKVYKKKELKISLPSYVDLELDSSSVIKVTVKNTGQVALHNIDIKVENIPFSWYSLNPASIDKLDVNEQIEAEINVSISKKQCSDCKSQYSVCIKAESDVNATKNFIINIKGVESKTLESETEAETKNTINIGASITGFATATSGLITQNITIILFLIILVISYKIIMRKKETHLDKRKVSCVDFIKELKDEITKDNPLKGGKYSFQISNKKFKKGR